jgi:hypothetical protein
VGKQKGRRPIIEPNEQHSSTEIVNFSGQLRTFSEAHPAAPVTDRQREATSLLCFRAFHACFTEHDPCQQKPCRNYRKLLEMGIGSRIDLQAPLKFDFSRYATAVAARDVFGGVGNGRPTWGGRSPPPRVD